LIDLDALYCVLNLGQDPYINVFPRPNKHLKTAELMGFTTYRKESTFISSMVELVVAESPLDELLMDIKAGTSTDHVLDLIHGAARDARGTLHEETAGRGVDFDTFRVLNRGRNVIVWTNIHLRNGDTVAYLFATFTDAWTFLDLLRHLAARSYRRMVGQSSGAMAFKRRIKANWQKAKHSSEFISEVLESAYPQFLIDRGDPRAIDEVYWVRSALPNLYFLPSAHSNHVVALGRICPESSDETHDHEMARKFLRSHSAEGDFEIKTMVVRFPILHSACFIFEADLQLR
jgi:hypothetical protein